MFVLNTMDPDCISKVIREEFVKMEINTEFIIKSEPLCKLKLPSHFNINFVVNVLII